MAKGGTVPGSKRLERYTMKLMPSQVAEDFTAQKPGMVAQETVIFNELAEMEDRVKAVVAASATAVDGSVKYSIWWQNFARKAYHIRRVWLGGTVLDTIYAALVARFAARGCTEATLLQILNEVFAWSPPA
jgi:hypothetical protein